MGDIRQAEEAHRGFQARTSWSRVPLWLRLALYVGSILTHLMVFIIVVKPFAPPFEPFSLTDRISDLPGGSVLALVNTSGWLAVGFLAGAALCWALYEVW